MAESPASASSMPRTLAEARTVIRNLRAQLGHGPPQPRPPAGDKPIPPKIDPQPVPNSDPIGPGSPVVGDLSNRRLAQGFETISTQGLLKWMRAESDPRTLRIIRAELKNRGV